MNLSCLLGQPVYFKQLWSTLIKKIILILSYLESFKSWFDCSRRDESLKSIILGAVERAAVRSTYLTYSDISFKPKNPQKKKTYFCQKERKWKTYFHTYSRSVFFPFFFQHLVKGWGGGEHTFPDILLHASLSQSFLFLIKMNKSTKESDVLVVSGNNKK